MCVLADSSFINCPWELFNHNSIERNLPVNLHLYNIGLVPISFSEVPIIVKFDRFVLKLFLILCQTSLFSWHNYVGMAFVLKKEYQKFSLDLAVIVYGNFNKKWSYLASLVCRNIMCICMHIIQKLYMLDLVLLSAILFLQLWFKKYDFPASSVPVYFSHF